MNKKGMTLVELVISIVIISVIIVFILNILITVKDAGIQNKTQTELIINQAAIIKTIEKDINEYGLTKVTSCSSSDLNQSGRNRIVPLDSNGNLPSNLYCLRLEYKTNILKTDNIGYLLQYTYQYSNTEYKNVYGYRRGLNRQIRESTIQMNPNDNPGTVTLSNKTGYTKCSLLITLPVIGENEQHYDITATYIYNCNQLTYNKTSNPIYGFRII